MKYTQILLKTLKESPADENSRNAELLIRGGFINKEMAGVYSYLPLGLKVLRKIENIVREEMEAVGASEILMPALSQKKNWEQTGRWDTVDILFKMELSGNREIALNPTHEEVVTPLVQTFANSPKDFPKCVFQIQNKFRNEPRAKSGLLRGREFLMKDAYSFHTTQEDFEKYYSVMTNAYHQVYKRLGIGDITKLVAADGGAFSEFSHEFQTLSPIGEDEIFYIKSEDRYINREITPCTALRWNNAEEIIAPMEDVLGKGIIGVTELAKFLKIPVEKTTKTILFETENGNVIAATVRGNREIDTRKLRKLVGCKSLDLASEETVKRVTGSPVGYAGVLNLPQEVQVFWDETCQDRVNFEMGANKENYHTININFGRDIEKPKHFYDIKVAQAGDFYPETGEPYETYNAIEVGNIFPLANKFSKAFKFNSDGVDIIMGCYGIGISRIMGVLAEIFSDEKGLIWPKNVAPAKVYLAPIGREDAVYEKADALYNELQKAGIEVLYDDRREKKVGPGQKFADAELIGVPYRVVISERSMETGTVEIVTRKTGETKNISSDKLISFFK
jgi:prolyl-tRNA synthetase